MKASNLSIHHNSPSKHKLYSSSSEDPYCRLRRAALVPSSRAIATVRRRHSHHRAHRQIVTVASKATWSSASVLNPHANIHGRTYQYTDTNASASNDQQQSHSGTTTQPTAHKSMISTHKHQTDPQNVTWSCLIPDTVQKGQQHLKQYTFGPFLIHSNQRQNTAR